MPEFTNRVKLTIIGAAVGFALIRVLAAYFGRRKRPRPRKNLLRKNESVVDGRMQHVGIDAIRRYQRRQGRSPVVQMRSPSHHGHTNGEVPNLRQSLSPELSQANSASTASMDMDAVSTSSTVNTLMGLEDTSELSAQQLCDQGMQAVRDAVSFWEEGIEKLDSLEDSEYNPAMEQLHEQLSQLLERAYRIQEYYEQKLFSQVNTTIALDAALEQMDKEYEERRHRRTLSVDTFSSDQDSFVSALDIADLSDLETQQREHKNLILYESALLLVKHGSVPCRTLRTKMLKCSSDSEFLAKLHCVRLAFQELFKDETIHSWFAETGKEMISNLLVKADKDPEDFQVAFDDLLKFAKDSDNWPQMEEELRGRGVKMLSFYDIVLDFILFDAFDDLENPPSSVTTVVQNRWLSNGFKETALATAVWSVLKAKRRLLKFSKGFIAHFYAISEHVSPVLAWGFLGPSGLLRDLCYFFKDEVQGLMRDVFSFTKARYTTVEELADDILSLARTRMTAAREKLSS